MRKIIAYYYVFSFFSLVSDNL